MLPGLVLRVTPGGIRTWVVEYHVATPSGGRRGARRKLGHLDHLDVPSARDEARIFLGALDRRLTLPGERGRGPLTVEQLVADCLADLELSETTRPEWTRLLKAEISPAFRGRLAADVRRAEIRAWGRKVRARSGWTANHAFEVLRRAYSWAVSEELLEASPCDRMPLPFKGESSERVLSAEELWALLRVLERARRHRPAYVDATELLLLTCARMRAVRGIRRQELEGLEGPDPRWVIPGGRKGRSKNRRPHVVPLVPAAVAIIRRRLEAVPLQHLFPIGRKRTGDDAAMTWSRPWVTWAKERVNRAVNARRRRDGEPREPVPRWTFHNIRHSIATHMTEDLGVAPDVVSLILSHTPRGPRVSRIYNRAERLPERRTALLAWAAWIEALRTGQAPARVLPFQGRR